ncbi:MAG: hypothetical protein ABGW82_07610, partial [Paracoccus sp. (in: a-proteobacteria)]
MAARNEILNQKRTPRKSGWMRTTALAAGFAAVGGAGVYYVLSQPDAADGALLETSQSAAIQQNDRSGVMVPDLGEPEIEATPVADDQGELDRLRTENERLAAQIAEEQEAAAERRRLFEERLDEIEQENADQLAAMQAQLESDYSRRQAEAAAVSSSSESSGLFSLNTSTSSASVPRGGRRHSTRPPSPASKSQSVSPPSTAT